MTGRGCSGVFLVAVFAATTGVRGVEDELPSGLAPHEAVREGNRRLKEGDAQKAIEFYRHAEERAPGAREVAFDQGLALFQLGRYAEAREKFRAAAAGQADRLADDAIYSEGTTYHAEALSEGADPKTMISDLESAMQRYQNVLANRPGHEAALEANYKAGMLWRRLKEQMKRQQQQQQSDQQGDENQEEQEQKQQQDQQQSQEDQQKERQSSPEEQEQREESQAQQRQQQQDQQSQEQEQQQEASDNKQQEQKASEAGQRERVSREQAERKLRELMQAVRQRKKDRRELVRPAPVKPVEKDW